MPKKIVFALFLFLPVAAGALAEFANHASLQALASLDIAETNTLLLQTVAEHDPGYALGLLKKLMLVNPKIAEECHPLVHEIGHAAYKKYNDFGKAISYHNEICISGYMHGVIEAAFVDAKSAFEAAKSFCAPYPPGKFLSWNCYHGIGHALMYYTGNNAPRSLSLCDAYAGPFARTSCVNGVFMENFNADTVLHPSEFLDSTDPTRLCRTLNESKQADCYLYAAQYYLRNSGQDFQKSFAWCGSVPPPFIQSCIAGIGGEAMKMHIDHPSYVEEICDKTDTKEHQSFCIDGMIGLYLYHTGSLSDTKKLCESLLTANQETCRSAVRNRESLFE